MLTIIRETCMESLHRWLALVLLILSILIPAGLLYPFASHLELLHGQWFLVSPRGNLPATVLAHEMLGRMLDMSCSLWLLLGSFAAAPLLTSSFEKGWVEVLLSKGRPRWQWIVGRMIGACLVFGVTLVILDAIPALYFHFKVGTEVGRFFTSLLFVLLSYLSIAVLMALVGVTRSTTSALVLVSFMQLFALSAGLAERKQSYQDVITQVWLQKILDTVYYILPKNYELARTASTYFISGTVPHWYVIWSTGIFIAVAGAVALVGTQRKSF